MSERWWRRSAWLLASITILVLATSAAGAQETPGAEPVEGGPLSKLEVHAFFNQAWAMSDGSIIEGIPEDGTTNYRTLALQFRYAITLDDIVLVQLQHEARGESVLEQVREEVEVDWAFYEHRFTDDAGIRIGRVRVPLGIYNEIRDVGTLLPFFEPPEGIYSDSLFTQEAVDGGAIYYGFRPMGGWRLSADAYFGEWERIIAPAGASEPEMTHVEDGAGLQLWLETPVDGLRVGLGGVRYDVTDSSGGFNVDEEDSWDLWVASVDGTFDRWTLRAEYMEADFKLRIGGIPFENSSYESYYGQVGYRLTDRWTVWGQYDVGDIALGFAGFPPFEATLTEDTAVSVTYAPRSEILFKAEVHTNDGILGRVEGEAPPMGSLTTDYAILSASVAF